MRRAARGRALVSLYTCYMVFLSGAAAGKPSSSFLSLFLFRVPPTRARIYTYPLRSSFGDFLSSGIPRAPATCGKFRALKCSLSLPLSPFNKEPPSSRIIVADGSFEETRGRAESPARYRPQCAGECTVLLLLPYSWASWARECTCTLSSERHNLRESMRRRTVAVYIWICELYTGRPASLDSQLDCLSGQRSSRAYPLIAQTLYIHGNGAKRSSSALALYLSFAR